MRTTGSLMFRMRFAGMLLLCGMLSFEADAAPRSAPPGVDIGAEHIFRSGLHDSSAEVEVFTAGVTWRRDGFSVGYETSEYNWSRAGRSGFLGGARTPWSDLTTVTAALRGTEPLKAGLLLSWGMRVRSAFERQVSGSFGAGADVALLRMFTRRWSGIAGVGANYDPRGDTVVLPVLGFRYDDEEVSGLSALLGLPSRLQYRVDERLRAGLKAGLASGTYRLRDNSPVQDKGYINHRAMVTGLTVDYSPLRRLDITCAALYLFERQWRVYDQRGSRRERVRLESGPGVSLHARWSF